jgi:hypothetical protein
MLKNCISIGFFQSHPLPHRFYNTFISFFLVPRPGGLSSLVIARPATRKQHETEWQRPAPGPPYSVRPAVQYVCIVLGRNDVPLLFIVQTVALRRRPKPRQRVHCTARVRAKDIRITIMIIITSVTTSIRVYVGISSVCFVLLVRGGEGAP